MTVTSARLRHLCTDMHSLLSVLGWHWSLRSQPDLDSNTLPKQGTGFTGSSVRNVVEDVAG